MNTSPLKEDPPRQILHLHGENDVPGPLLRRPPQDLGGERRGSQERDRTYPPGVTCAELAMELNHMYAEFGLLKYRMFGYGHSFGTMSHYYGREAGKYSLFPSYKREVSL